MKPRETTISGYINVYDGSTWHKQWAELVDETLSLYLFKNDLLKPSFSIDVKGMVIQPAVKETNHMLAFQLVETGKTKLLIEPLNMLDMGRWISCLFMAIQGVTLEQSRKEIVTSVTNATESIQLRKHTTFNGKDDGHRGEKESCLVDVKKIAQMFENMAKNKALSQKESSFVRRRTQSSPNLLAERQQSLNEKHQDAESESTNANNEESSLCEEPMEEDTKPVIVATILKVTKEADVKSWQGPYKAQDTEKQVLKLVANPFLAKKRLSKHEQQIKKMEATIQEINDSVKRQKNSLAETKEIISELQNKTNGTKEQEEIIKLENDCTHLEMQIQESEGNVEHYKLLIQQIENEMTNLSSSVQFDQTQNEKLETVDGQNNYKIGKKEQEKETVESINEPQTASPYDYEDDKVETKEAPIWAKRSQEKAKNACKILAEQGMLD